MIDHVSDELLSQYTIGLPEESELGWEEEDFLICGCRRTRLTTDSS
jgi:hypothetical protein